MVLIRRYFSLLAILLSSYLAANADGSSIDSKFVKVGYVSNFKLTNSDNSHIRNLGSINELSSSYDFQNSSTAQIADLLNSQGIGKKVLDLLLQRDAQGLHIEELYNIALSNVTLSEDERASLDKSADKQDVLKKTIVRQILKNNYIILTDNRGTEGYRVRWRVYHVDIDDNVIDQVFLNWEAPNDYEKIKVPVSFVSEGRAYNNDKILNGVVSKIKAFAPHSPIMTRYPFIVDFGTEHGAKLLDRVEVFRLYEDKKGNISDRKICATRVTELTSSTARLFSINGGYASQNKGDIAVLRKSRRLNNISIVAQGSFGEDYRYGARIFYERILKLNKHGVSQYILGSIEYNRYCREPEGVWLPYFDAEEYARPTLSNFGASVGYSVGFMGLLGKIEIAPYAMAGFKVHTFDRDVIYVYSSGAVGENEYGPNLGFDICGGVKANINIWYPLQLTLGVDYNFDTSSVGEKVEEYIDHHTINRLNVYAGFRFNF